MKVLVSLTLSLACLEAMACDSSLPLEGSVVIPTCELGSPHCKTGAVVLQEYAHAHAPDDRPDVLTVGVQASPWRIYDADLRILDVAALAKRLRPHLKSPVTSVELQASWTGIAPDKAHKSLAVRLSTALGGYPVRGMDGFVWFRKDGSVRTTRQAFSVRDGAGSYSVRDGDDVMAALAVGWPAFVEDRIANDGNAKYLMQAGVGWDVFFLCPEHALATFERAGRMGNAIAAYNAAMMRIERGEKDDKAAAIQLLSQAAARGDVKSREALKELTR